MPNFAVTLVRATDWNDSRGIREQRAWDEHAAFMDRLVDDGFIQRSGRACIGDPTDSGRERS